MEEMSTKNSKHKVTHKSNIYKPIKNRWIYYLTLSFHQIFHIQESESENYFPFYHSADVQRHVYCTLVHNFHSVFCSVRTISTNISSGSYRLWKYLHFMSQSNFCINSHLKNY